MIISRFREPGEYASSLDAKLYDPRARTSEGEKFKEEAAAAHIAQPRVGI